MSPAAPRAWQLTLHPSPDVLVDADGPDGLLTVTEPDARNRYLSGPCGTFAAQRPDGPAFVDASIPHRWLLHRLDGIPAGTIAAHGNRWTYTSPDRSLQLTLTRARLRRHRRILSEDGRLVGAVVPGPDGWTYRCAHANPARDAFAVLLATFAYAAHVPPADLR